MEELGINLPKFLYQVVNFVIVVWVLYVLLYKRILTMLNERTERIAQSIRDSEQVKEQLANAKRDYDAEIAKARQEAVALRSQAEERARQQEQEILAKAREEAEQIKADMMAQADQQREQMLREVREQVAELVTLTAERVLRDELKGRHDKLIDESLAALNRQN
jgi:F-type H+-transporting ATPase subunit b